MKQELPTLEEAVKIHKLDRRFEYMELGGEVIYSVHYTSPCTGCSCDCSDGHGCNHGNVGCFECGYTGKRRDSVPIPCISSNGKNIKCKPSNYLLWRDRKRYIQESKAPKHI